MGLRQYLACVALVTACEASDLELDLAVVCYLVCVDDVSCLT